MTTSTEEWLSHLHRLIDRDNYIYADDLRNWGFTIYRTCYTPSSDEEWPQLLETIQTCAHNDVLSQTQSKEDDAQFKKVMSLFRLDARSDPSLQPEYHSAPRAIQHHIHRSPIEFRLPTAPRLPRRQRRDLLARRARHRHHVRGRRLPGGKLHE
jgi:hypothetical protein